MSSTDFETVHEEPTHGLQEQKTAALAKLNAKILSIFPTQIDGYPTALSQYGIFYLTIANGLVRSEGAPVIDRELPDAIADCVTWFKNRRAEGHDLLVWRKRPVIEQDRNGHPRVWMRCHTMRASDNPRVIKPDPTE